jgi:hypothetical protein
VVKKEAAKKLRGAIHVSWNGLQGFHMKSVNRANFHRKKRKEGGKTHEIEELFAEIDDVYGGQQDC